MLPRLESGLRNFSTLEFGSVLSATKGGLSMSRAVDVVDPALIFGISGVQRAFFVVLVGDESDSMIILALFPVLMVFG